VLAGGERLASCLACFTPREIALLSSEYEAVWALEPVWTSWGMENLFPLLGF